jgi:N-acetylglucosaminyl-diphospho-decaprenol L-rhamnosyltransferase
VTVDISVVVVTYDSAERVGRCLASVAERLPGAELVVVDNASSDETVPIVEAGSAAKLIRNKRNVGFGRAANAGVEAATRSHVLLLNPDVLITRADVAGLTSLLRDRPFGLVAPLLTWEGRRGGTVGAQAERHWLSDYFDHTVQTVTPRGLLHSRRPANESGRRWASAAMLLAARDEFLRLGGFDPRFFLYYEDRDLSARYRDAGLPIRSTDALAGHHVGGGSSSLDDLRVSSLGWAFLGWVEYLYLHEGEPAAQRRAKAGLRTLRAIAGGMQAARRVARAGAVDRKGRQLSELLAFLREQSRNGASADGKPFCPDARRLIRELE